MVNDENHNSNDDDKNPSSMLEHLLIIQAQFLQTVQQVMVQMQDINHLMQSMEVRPSSRKRKSNTKDDVGQAQKIRLIEKATPNHKEGSMSTKVTTICSNCGEVGHFANRCPQDRGNQNVQSTPTDQTANENLKGKKCYNCGQKGHFTLQCRNPDAHPLLMLSSTKTPPPNPQAKGKEEVHPEV
jgi:hypothetical protein